jgi:hypothetical protein
MQTVAHGRQAYLDQEGVRIAQKLASQCRTALGGVSECLSREAQGGARNLNDGPEGVSVCPEEDGETHHALSPDDRHFSHLVTLRGTRMATRPSSGK